MCAKVILIYLEANGEDFPVMVVILPAIRLRAFENQTATWFQQEILVADKKNRACLLRGVQILHREVSMEPRSYFPRIQS